MKIKMKRLLGFLTLLALFSVPRLASAYYDPGVQRWINRDPLGESGFERLRKRLDGPWPAYMNDCFYVANAPMDFIDALGLVPSEVSKCVEDANQAFASCKCIVKETYLDSARDLADLQQKGELLCAALPRWWLKVPCWVANNALYSTEMSALGLATSAGLAACAEIHAGMVANCAAGANGGRPTLPPD